MSARFLSTLIVGGALCGGPAHGQAVEQDEATLDNIVVTASRSPLSRPDIGSATTLITRDQIEQRQVRYVTDILRSVPGFAISQVGTSGSQTQVRVRGAEANHVLVLIDGVRANDPASGDEFRWELLSTSNVERIEIVRGPQSSLWGSDAVAAVVHVITRSGSGRPGVGGYAEGGSHNTLNSGFNGTTGGENWSLGFGVERLDTDGTNVSRTGSENDDSDLTTASVSFKAEAGDALAFNAGLRVVDAYSQFDPVDFFATGLPRDGDVATDAERYYWHGGAALGTFGGRVVHRLNARFLDSENRNMTDGVVDSGTASDRQTFSYQVDWRLGDNILSTAVEHERTGFEQRGEIGFGDPNQDQRYDVTSYVADFQGRPSDRLTWLLSGRFDDFSDFDSASSGRLSLAYRLSESTNVRANVGTGRKVPTFTERFGFFPGQFIGNPNLKPESSRSYDLGVDRLLFGGSLELQVSVFYQDLDDEIDGFVFDADSFLFTAQNIDGSSTRKGAELAAAYRIAEQISVGGTYTYTDATERDPAGAAVRELRRPMHRGSVNGSFRFLEDRAGIVLVADYGGSSVDRFFPPFPAAPEVVRLDSHWVVDLTASFDLSRNVTAYLRASNLFDEDYEQVVGYRTPGRSVVAGIRAGFGQFRR